MFVVSSEKFQVNVLFQVKVQFILSNAWQKGQSQSAHIYGIFFTTMLLAWCWVTLTFGFEIKSFAKQKSLVSLTLWIACWQNPKNTTAYEMQFQCLICSASKALYFWTEGEINIPARCHMHLECWQCVVKLNPLNISQSYFWVVRVTHNSNSLAHLKDFTRTFSPCGLFMVLHDSLSKRGTTCRPQWFVSRGSCLVTHWAEREGNLCLAWYKTPISNSSI